MSKLKTVNISDKISTRDAELVSEMVTDALIDMGISLGEDPSFSWSIEVDYEEKQMTQFRVSEREIELFIDALHKHVNILKSQQNDRAVKFTHGVIDKLQNELKVRSMRKFKVTTQGGSNEKQKHISQ